MSEPGPGLRQAAADQAQHADDCCDVLAPGSAGRDEAWLRDARWARALSWASLAWMTIERGSRAGRRDRGRLHRAGRLGAVLGGRGPGQRDRDLAVHRIPHPLRNRRAHGAKGSRGLVLAAGPLRRDRLDAQADHRPAPPGPASWTPSSDSPSPQPRSAKPANMERRRLLLTAFQPCVTAPSFRTFCAGLRVLDGMILTSPHQTPHPSAWGATIGRPAFITSTVSGILGSAPRSFRQWVADHATAFMEGPTPSS